MNLPLPPGERQRLEALERYEILDTPPEPAFDRITRLAARLLKVPVALITLVDKDRQWFKSSQGFQALETSRELSFCAHAILSNEVLVVPDATRDARFQDNPLVTREPNIRFYAGAPLRSVDGFRVGTLCIIDTAPRQFGNEEQQTLAELAALASDELELRLAIRQSGLHVAAISQLKSGVVITNPNLPDNPIIFANPGFCAMTGYVLDEIMGRNCRWLQGPKTDPQTVAKISEAIAARRPFHGEVLNYRKDGTPFWNELTIGPVFDSAGALMRFVGLQSDVTERKQLEAMRDNLTHMIVHDLRSPLASVIGFLDLAQTGDNHTARDDEFLRMAHNAALTLQDMITSLLDINRIEAGEMPLNLRQVDLRELVASVCEPLLPVIGHRSLVRDLPAHPVLARCDPKLIERVLDNLLSNAIKFTPDGGAIRVTIAAENDCAKVSISDSGPGVPAEYHARIFEKFGQVEGRQDRHSTGLGLSFCKLAVEAQGGRIGVENTNERGTVFWFTTAPWK